MAKVFSGAKGSLKINGQKIAFVGSINITEENALTRIDVLDQLQSAELAETGHSVSFTCNLFKIDGNAAIQVGITPANIDEMLTQPDLTMEIFNRIDGRVEYTISGVKFSGGSGSLDARGVWNGQWSFEGLIGRGL